MDHPRTADGTPHRLCVVGLGKLGTPIAACLASRGFAVIGVDADLDKVEAIRAGRAPVYEPGLRELLGETAGRLQAMTDLETAVAGSEVTYIVVPTPSEPDGGFSLRYVLEACDAIGRGIRRHAYHLVVLTSTVMPGSTRGPVRLALEAVSGKTCGDDFGLCYSPEFVALGTVIRDFLQPDFVLIGESDTRAGELLESVERRARRNDPPIVRTGLEGAELAKLAVNTFVTTKITFANMLARLCEAFPGADADAVSAALGLDSRIGGKYLRGAISYGGPCFPRDNRALARVAASVGVPVNLPEETDRFNRWQLAWLVDRVTGLAGAGERVGVLGLSYKPGSDVVEEAAGTWLAGELAARGFPVVAFDPAANEAAAAVLPASVELAAAAAECVARADLVVVATPWPQFRDIPVTVWGRHSRPRVVVDCWRLVPDLAGVDGVRYLPLGRSWS